MHSLNISNARDSEAGLQDTDCGDISPYRGTSRLLVLLELAGMYRLQLLALLVPVVVAHISSAELSRHVRKVREH